MEIVYKQMTNKFSLLLEPVWVVHGPRNETMEVIRTEGGGMGIRHLPYKSHTPPACMLNFVLHGTSENAQTHRGCG